MEEDYYSDKGLDWRNFSYSVRSDDGAEPAVIRYYDTGSDDIGSIIDSYVSRNKVNLDDVNDAIYIGYCKSLCPYEEECKKYCDSNLCAKWRIMKELRG